MTRSTSQSNSVSFSDNENYATNRYSSFQPASNQQESTPGNPPTESAHSSSEREPIGFFDKLKRLVASLFSTAKSAARLSAKVAERTRISNVSLPKAFVPLGKHAYSSEELRDNFVEAFGQVDKLMIRIDQINQGIAQEKQTDTAAQKAKAFARDSLDKGKLKACKVQLYRAYSKLGQQIFDSLGTDYGPREIVEPIHELVSKHKELQLEIEELDSGGKTGFLSPKIFAIGVMVVGLVGACYAAGSFLSGSKAKEQSEFADFDQNDSPSEFSENGIDETEGGSGRSKFDNRGGGSPPPDPNEKAFQQIDKSKNLGSPTPESIYDKYTKPQIPSDYQSADLPKNTILFVPCTLDQWSVHADGRYIRVKDRILDMYTGRYLPGRFTEFIIKCISKSGKYMVAQGYSGLFKLYKIGAARPKSVLKLVGPGHIPSSFDPEPSVEVLDANHLQNAISISPKDSFIAYRDQDNATTIISLSRGRKIQTLYKTKLPVTFSDNEKQLFTIGDDGQITNYKLKKNRFERSVRIGPRIGFVESDRPVAFNSNYMLLLRNANETRSYMPNGITIYRLGVDGAKIERSKYYNMIQPSRIYWRSNRFALTANERDNRGWTKANWLYYGDASTGEIKFYSLPLGDGLEQINYSLVGLDESGRYAFLKGLGGIAVVRLEDK